MIDVVNGRATMLLAPLTYTLAAEEAERIGVDHVARVSSGEASLNSLGIYKYIIYFFDESMFIQIYATKIVFIN